MLFITPDTPCVRPDTGRLYWTAWEVGFRPFVVRPESLRTVRGETRACGGFEALSNGDKRLLCSSEVLSPDIVFHYWIDLSPSRQALLAQLGDAHPSARLLYHPELLFVCTKWGAELCFRAGEERDIRVARPETSLMPKDEMLAKLGDIGRHRSLIFKPAEGSQGRGIRISTPATFDAVVEEVVRAVPPQFVAQRLVENAVHLDGRKFDLRVYALVTGFRPLRFEVFRGGMARLAGAPRFADGAPDAQSVLTNCDYRARSGAAVDNLTIPQLLDALRARGYGVDDFWPKVEALAERVFACYAAWEPLTTTPNLSRLFLVAGLDMLLVEADGAVEPLFLESNYGSCAAKDFGPSAVDAELRATNREWLAALFASTAVPAAIAQPYRSPSLPVGGARTLPDTVAARTCEGSACRAGASPSRSVLFRFPVGNAGGEVLHPHQAKPTKNSAHEFDPAQSAVAMLFPGLEGDDRTVETKPWPGAAFEFLDPGVLGPRVRELHATRDENLLAYLGRVITTESTGEPLTRRTVEPGVGRSVLVDLLRIENRPDLRDFSALGVGLTPYSEGGFFLKGPDIDGLCSLKKAVHRQQVADRLEVAGCRVPRTVAIVSLPDLWKTWPDDTKEPAAILVRGFRTILRVQQLDPLHGFLLSDRHRSFVTAHLLDRARAERSGYSDPYLLCAIETLNCRHKCLRDIVQDELWWAAPETDRLRKTRDLRLREILSYAPVLLALAKARAATELGRDAHDEALTDDEYVTWFAESMANQLAVMKGQRFLFDYRMARDDWTTNALSAAQVSLLAELIDLDTGVFMDTTDESVLLTAGQVRTLQTRYEDFHARDLDEAKSIVRSLALIVSRRDVTRVHRALQHFVRTYESATSNVQLVLA